MKLSEALRLGEFALNPSSGNWFEWEKEQLCGGCAVGRTCLAAGFKPKLTFNTLSEDPRKLAEFIGSTWPWTYKVSVVFPIDERELSDNAFWQEGHNQVMDIISNLYECAGWTMTQIADFIATIEPQEFSNANLATDETAPQHAQASAGPV